MPLPPASSSARRTFLAALLASGTAAAANPPLTLRVGPGQRLRTLHDGVHAAAAGDTIELLPGDYRADVAVVTQAKLTIRGLGSGAVFHADGADAEGKAILVVRGHDVLVENCEFRGARVADGNGAGIRFERGRLGVLGCRFFDNEMGLLAANDPTQELTVRDSQFGEAPHHEGLLHHLLYVGAIGRFTLTGSRFGGGWRGHLVKSRAASNRVLYNRIDDGLTGEASYELEFPNGGDNLVVGNLIVQSPRSQNPTIVSMGAEARDGMAGRLRLAFNTIVNHGDSGGRFVHVWTDRLRGATPVHIADNLFVGPGALGFSSDHDGGGNQRVGLEALRDAPAADYRLAAGSPLEGSAVLLPAEEMPQAEFRSPAGTRPLPASRQLSPGAFQLP